MCICCTLQESVPEMHMHETKNQIAGEKHFAPFSGMPAMKTEEGKRQFWQLPHIYVNHKMQIDLRLSH